MGHTGPVMGSLLLGSWVTDTSAKCYIRGCVHRNSRLKKSNKMQQYADIYLLLNYCTCFGRPSSGVHKTVVAVSGRDHTIWGASFLERDAFEEDCSTSSAGSPSLKQDVSKYRFRSYRTQFKSNRAQRSSQ